MKKTYILLPAMVVTASLLAGCIGGLSLGGGSKNVEQKPTVGQQLVDLKRAKDTGAINDTEYESQKAKILAQH